jgi:allantoate deiminase
MNLDTILGSEVMTRCAELALHTEEPGRLTRTYLTTMQREAAETLIGWMQQAGMKARMDEIGNVIGRYEALAPNAPAVLVGSHFDTVVNAGIYDGNYGIIAGIACVKALNQQGIRLPHAIEIVAFAEEEGVRFKTTMMGSMALAGTFDSRVLDKTDKQGITMAQALRDYGLDPVKIGRAEKRQEDVLGYLEVHIEQGPVLLSEGLSCGVVTGIAGYYRFACQIKGVAGHAGTVPMTMRNDAGAAAAEMVMAVERYCVNAAGEVEGGLVGTVGQLNVPGGAINVIPGACEFTIDLRSGHDPSRHAAWKEIEGELRSIARRRKVELTITQMMELAAAPCAPRLMEKIEAAVKRTIPTDFIRRLPSGAGHDAMAMHALTEQAMLFIRCGNGGVSHNPLETITEHDARTGARVLYDVLVNFSNA